ncbi:S-adenosyl-L-methionine-dependent methyltransferase MraW2 [Acetobacterium woodii DSM 1030]|uniref:S-adenosyl-L-methionine-dependent methyltransferase MraW2 n=1 Tax=Acetobacterium woodii (strain ATCC 29683 / DSM 1030 / JCM 2381 / KCTC 1655 / WB1) TaxID=931626 RepID=H6LCH7_ACEWD|nr:S-adenosyl-L-methionine-dependent methyltransferase MraW2 [Acetobacterium woodii DSM 1030]
MIFRGNFLNHVQVAVTNRLLRVTQLAWDFLRPVINPGDIVVDATAGTGQDSLFLLQCVGSTGRVFSFDVQAAAIQQTKKMIEDSGCSGKITFVQKSHALIVEVLKQENIQLCTVKAVMFNLGYFPGGDQKLVTNVETTLKALSGALALLAPGGMITVCLYSGHPGGLAESEAVIKWAETLEKPFMAHHFRTLNRKLPPTLVLIQRTR